MFLRACESLRDAGRLAYWALSCGVGLLYVLWYTSTGKIHANMQTYTGTFTSVAHHEQRTQKPNFNC